MNKRKLSGYAIPLVLLLSTQLSAYETDWENKKSEERSMFRVDGTIVTSYQFADKDGVGGYSHETNPVDGSALANGQGFTMDRVYLNVRGKVKSGPIPGLAYRVTSDVYNDNKDTNVRLKFAYVDFPIFEGAAIRIGQQGLPTVSSPVYSLIGINGHRYLTLNSGLGAKFAGPAWTQLGFGSSADRGVSVFYKSDFIGFHVGVFNGEGFKEDVNDSSSKSVYASDAVWSDSALPAMAYGSRGAGKNAHNNQSSGLDVVGLLNVPIVKTDYTKIDLNLPFAFKSALGEKSTDHNHIQIDYTDLSSPGLVRITGDKRSRQDVLYGLELDADYKDGNFSFTLGGGPYFFHDKRGSAVRLDASSVPSPGAVVDVANFYYNPYTGSGSYLKEEDRTLRGTYLFGRVQKGKWELFAQYASYEGNDNGISGGTSMNGYEQLLFLDLTDSDVIPSPGNIDPLDALYKISYKKARTEITTLALSWIPVNSLTFSIGYTVKRMTLENGREARISPLVSTSDNRFIPDLGNAGTDGLIDAVYGTDYGANLTAEEKLQLITSKRDVETQTYFVMQYDF